MTDIPMATIRQLIEDLKTLHSEYSDRVINLDFLDFANMLETVVQDHLDEIDTYFRNEAIKNGLVSEET